MASMLFASVLLTSAISGTTPGEVAPEKVPAACRAFTTRVADARDNTFAWNQRLSLAACIQDTSTATVKNREEADALFQELARRLTPTVRLDIDALEHAPPAFRIRAAYQVAMASMSLVIRMRGAVAEPKSPLHAYVESLVDAPLRTSYLAAAVIAQTANEAPELVADPVTAYQVRDAKALLAQMPPSIREKIGRDLEALRSTAGAR